MCENALVSAVIPTYNRAHLLNRAVQSVLRQSYSNVECIIVDDGSTDSTAQEINGIKAKDGQTLVYEKLDKNSGACAARNRGIDKASGEYIAFLDSDDVWHEDYIERQLQFLNSSLCDVVLCRMEVFDKNGEHNHFFPKDDTEEGNVPCIDLLRYNLASTQAMFGKSEAFKKVKFDEEMPRMQDWDEALRLSECYKVRYQKAVLVDTYLQEDSITRRPELGVAAMERIFKKHEAAILLDNRAAVSIFRKWASCVKQSGGKARWQYLMAAKHGGGLKDWARCVLG